MKLWLIACLLVGAPVYSAAVRERMQAVVAENNTNVERTKNLYKFLPVPLVNIVFGYMRAKIERYGVSQWSRQDDRPTWIIVFNKECNEHDGRHLFFETGLQLSPSFFKDPRQPFWSMAAVDQNTLRGLKFLGDGSYGFHEQNLRSRRHQMCEQEARRRNGESNALQKARDIADAWYNKEKRKLDIEEESRLMEGIVRGKISEKKLLDCRELTVPGVEAVFLAKEQYGEDFILINDGQNW